MRYLLIVLVGASLVSAPALGQESEPRATTVIAEIARAHRSRGRCHVSLRILAVEGEDTTLRDGEIVAATTSCHGYAMHQMRNGGRFRFRLQWSSSVPRAIVIGGRRLR